MQVRKDIHQKQREEVNIAHSFDTNLKSRIHLPIMILCLVRGEGIND